MLALQVKPCAIVSIIIAVGNGYGIIALGGAMVLFWVDVLAVAAMGMWRPYCTKINYQAKKKKKCLFNNNQNIWTAHNIIINTKLCL